MMQKMIVTRRTKIGGRYLDKGSTIEVHHRVAAGLRARYEAKDIPTVPAVPSTPADVTSPVTVEMLDLWKANGVSFRKASQLSGVKAAGWNDLRAKVGGAD